MTSPTARLICDMTVAQLAELLEEQKLSMRVDQTDGGWSVRLWARSPAVVHQSAESESALGALVEALAGVRGA